MAVYFSMQFDFGLVIHVLNLRTCAGVKSLLKIQCVRGFVKKSVVVYFRMQCDFGLCDTCVKSLNTYPGERSGGVTLWCTGKGGGVPLSRDVFIRMVDKTEKCLGYWDKQGGFAVKYDHWKRQLDSGPDIDLIVDLMTETDRLMAGSDVEELVENLGLTQTANELKTIHSMSYQLACFLTLDGFFGDCMKMVYIDGMHRMRVAEVARLIADCSL